MERATFAVRLAAGDLKIARDARAISRVTRSKGFAAPRFPHRVARASREGLRGGDKGDSGDSSVAWMANFVDIGTLGVSRQTERRHRKKMLANKDARTARGATTTLVYRAGPENAPRLRSCTHARPYAWRRVERFALHLF